MNGVQRERNRGSLSAAAGLGASASRGAAFTMGGQLARILIQFAGILIIARLLSPTDYGLVAMVTAIIGIGEVLRDFGLSQAAVQSRDMTPALRNNLFWLNTFIGAVVAIAVAAVSPLIAAFYGEPRLVPITLALSVTFLFNGMTTQYRASLSRSLRLGTLAVIDVVSPAAGLVVAVGLAWWGAGYWALVWQQVVAVVVLLVMVVAASRWIPRGFTRGAGTKRLIGFGSSVFFSQLIGYASRNVDSVVIGSTLGAASLGIYNRAFQILLLPLNQLNAPATRVAIPVLSRLQDDRARYAEFIVTGQAVMLHVTMAVFSVACALAQPLILIVLGEQWGAAAPVFQVLAIAGVFQTASSASYWVFFSKGLSKPLFWWSLLSRPLLILSVLTGAFWGMMGVAWGYSLGLLVLWPLGLIWLGRVSDAPVLAMFWNGIRGVVIYTACGVACFAAFVAGGALPVPVSIALGVLAWLAMWAAVVALWPAARADVRRILRAVSLMRKRRGFGTATP